jgi:hypothetical protein
MPFIDVLSTYFRGERVESLASADAARVAMTDS